MCYNNKTERSRSDCGLIVRSHGSGVTDIFALKANRASGLARRGVRLRNGFPGQFGGALEALGVESGAFEDLFSLDLHRIRR